MTNLYYLIIHACIALLTLQTNEESISEQQTANNITKRIQALRESSSLASKTPEDRIADAELALKLSNELKVDTTILLSSRNLAFQYMIFGESEKHLDISRFNLTQAEKLNDSLALSYTYDNLGYNFYVRREYDSAYFYYSLAIKSFKALDIVDNRIRVLIDMAKIFRDEKDYAGSDEFLIEALSLLNAGLKTQKNIISQRRIYDILASNSMAIEDYDKALSYYRKCLELIDELDDGYLERMFAFNNIAAAFRETQRYEEALDYYNKVYSETEVFKLDPPFYPLILTNIAFTKHLQGLSSNEELERLFHEAYDKSHELNDEFVQLAVSIDMAKYYNAIQQRDSTRKFAQESYRLARDITDNEILLESILLLAKSENEAESRKYFNEYIELNDSILQKERSARNKFARIKFETEEIEKENQRIAEQRKWLIMLSAGLILTSILLYVIINQRAKNKELQFIQDQQKSNEEIYNLLLSQQDKVDEARANEKKRISQEIHDGILGRMFGVRLSLDSLNFTSGPDAVKNRSQYISELKTIEDEMRKVSHELNTDFVAGSGFMDILNDLIVKQTSAYGLEYSFDFTDDISWEIVSNKIKINIYRIVQEALQNIYKHAGADKVWISILLKKNVIWMSIRDDGKGFDTSKGKKGIGIKNINSRLTEINGKVKYQSIIGQGTSVEVNIPYDSELT